jgi:RES domain-containing protein
VPSAIVPESPNLLLNPRHPDAQAARMIQDRRFVFDRRLRASI